MKDFYRIITEQMADRPEHVTTAAINPQLFPSLQQEVASLIIHLENVREFTPNPAILDRRISNWRAVLNGLDEINKAQRLQFMQTQAPKRPAPQIQTHKAKVETGGKSQ